MRTREASPGENFENAVGFTASEVLALLERGNLVALRTDSEFVESGHGLRHRTRLLTFLALVAPDETPATDPLPPVRETRPGDERPTDEREWGATQREST